MLLRRFRVFVGRLLTPRKMSTSVATNVALSLTGLVAIIGAGVAVGSGVGMSVLAMAKEEQQRQQGASAVAHSVIEKRPSVASNPSRGFAAGNQ
jgi:hypothetical protein